MKIELIRNAMQLQPFLSGNRTQGREIPSRRFVTSAL